MATEPTALKMHDGSEQYGVVILMNKDGTLKRWYEISAGELRAIKAGKPLPGGEQGVVVGKPLRVNEAMKAKNGKLWVAIGEKLNSFGVPDYELVLLQPEEWDYKNKVIGVDSAAIAVIPKLKGRG